MGSAYRGTVPIGNQAEYEEGTPALTTDYLSNVLNQYEYLGTDANKPSAQNLAHDADGDLVEAFIVADMNCDGALNSYDIDPFVLALTDPDEYEQQYPDCDIMNADVNGDGVVNSFDSTAFSAMLASGNTATWLAYEWNAENRLTAVVPQAPQAGDKKVEFAYDYMGRRIEKKVYDWNDQTEQWEATPSLHRKFVWSGWLKLMELDGNNDPVRKYTWGLDLSQTFSGAGGIGGLLAVYDDAEEEDYVYLYDANGNVGQVVAWASGFGGATGDQWHADRLVAHYEYDPYANIVNQTGAYAEENPYRFSTKPFDNETGLCSWIFRYYDPRTGRWLSRDPLEEGGGFNLYTFMWNEAIAQVDPFGLKPIPSDLPENQFNSEEQLERACKRECRLRRCCKSELTKQKEVSYHVGPPTKVRDNFVQVTTRQRTKYSLKLVKYIVTDVNISIGTLYENGVYQCRHWTCDCSDCCGYGTILDLIHEYATWYDFCICEKIGISKYLDVHTVINKTITGNVKIDVEELIDDALDKLIPVSGD